MHVLMLILEWGAGIAFAVWTFTARPANAAKQKQARRGR